MVNGRSAQRRLIDVRIKSSVDAQILANWGQSCKKKFKDRDFAAGVDREEVSEAAEEFGVDLKEHVQFVIEAMRGVAGELGLEGEKCGEG